MVVFQLLLREIRLAERLRPAQEIVIDVMSVDQVVVVAHNADLRYNINVCAEFFFEFTLDGSLEIFTGFNSAAGCLYASSASEIIVTHLADKIVETFFINNDRPDNVPVVVGRLKRPFVVF